MRRSLPVALLTAVLSIAMVSPAFAGPNKAGNGAGASRQCTGPQSDRPAACQSQGGPGDQG